MAFHPDDLLPWLPDSDATCHVAYSGGLDSHVLLYAMAALRDNGLFCGDLHAIHVNHGLNPLAADWASHCRGVCDDLAIPLHVEHVTVSNRGQGIEQAAREARYGVFANRVRGGEYLLTAHHLDDQVETLLFRLLRGTGLRGLAGIRRRRALVQATVLRPLLDVSREALQAYADREGLAWIEDDSNADEALDRNYLRHKILPALAARWPGFRKSWQRLAGQATQAQALLEEVGLADLAQVRAGEHRLSLAKLGAFSPARQRNLVRCWLLALEREHGIPAPDAYVVARLFSEVIPAAADAEPVVNWRNDGQAVEIRRFAGHLYVVLPRVPPAPGTRLPWDLSGPLELPAGLGILELVECPDAGFLLPESGVLEVGFRRGGESLKPAGRKTRSLKKILQDYRVPPWLRDGVPLVFAGDDTVALADLFLCEGWQVQAAPADGRKLFRIHWQKADLHCGT